MKNLARATCAVLALIGNAWGFGSPSEAFPVVNVIRLICRSEDYSGKPVQVMGWLSVYHGKEGTTFTLYPTKEAMDFRDVSCAIALEPTSLKQLLSNDEELYRLLNGECVRLQGTFEQKESPNGEQPPVFLGLHGINYLQQVKPGVPYLSSPR